MLKKLISHALLHDPRQHDSYIRKNNMGRIQMHEIVEKIKK